MRFDENQGFAVVDIKRILPCKGLCRVLRAIARFSEESLLVLFARDIRHSGSVNFNAWNMLPLLARDLHQPRIFQATKKHCPSARSERTAMAVSNLSLAAVSRSRDIANAWHC